MAENWYINESALDYMPNFNGSLVVNGCPGSGKTIMALWKAREIEDNEMGTYYFIVPNKVLKQFVATGFEDLGLSKTQLVYHQEWKNQLANKTADYVIVDDAHHYTKNELNELLISANKQIVFFGNWAGLSNVYSDPYRFMGAEQLALNFQLELISLVISNHLSKKVARLADSIDNFKELERRCIKEGANKPFLVKANNWVQQLDFIMDTIDEKGYTDIGILLPDNKLVKRAFEFYKDNSFKVEAKYDISHPEHSQFDIDFKSSNPKLMTYQSSQGLRFETVMLPFCSEEHVTSYSEDIFYKALTRTNQDLYILYSGELSNFLKEIPKDLIQEIEIGENKDLFF